MKKSYAILAAAVLTLSLFTGCGCRNSAPAPTTAPTTMPTMATTVPTTEATTVPTTAPTTAPTDATIQDGNGPISTDATEATNARSRGIGSGNGITGSITG